MKNKKLIGWSLFGLAILAQIRFGNFGTSGEDNVDIISANPSQKQQSSPLPEVPETQPLQPKAWVFDRQTVNPKNNSRMDWSVPITSLNQATEWFNVENVSYWGYRVKSDCLIEYKFKDITRKNVVVKIEYKNSNHYTEGTTELWKPDRLLEVVDNTAEMRFIPLPGQSLVGPTIYRSE